MTSEGLHGLLMEFYFITIIVTIIGFFMAITFLSMPCLDYLLGYSTGELRDLQLIVLVVFGAVD